MATAYTSLLGFALPVTGELSGTWGDTVNDSITKLVEDSIAGVATVSVTSGNVTLTTTGSGAANQARCAIIIATGTPGTARQIIAPSQSKAYIVINQSDSNVTFKGAATTGHVLKPGDANLLAWNGSDFQDIEQGDVAGPASATDNAVVRFDGTTGKLIQNSAVTIADTTGDIETSGKISVGDGTASLPSITNTGDTNTGIYFPAENQVGIATNGNFAALVDASGNVGIGTTSPQVQLWRAGATLTVQGTTAGNIEVGSSRADGAGVAVGAVEWAWTAQDATHKHLALIEVDSEGATAGQRGGAMKFLTKPNGTATPAERMRITATGFTQPVAYADTVVALGNTGTASTITLTSGNVFTATLTGNCTFTLSAPIATGSSSFTLILTNDGTAGRTVAWSGGSFVFPGGAATLSRTTTANAVDVWVFFTPNGGTTWYGNIAMKDMKA
jgi:hypothetical protein